MVMAHADRGTLAAMDEEVRVQASALANLPGVVTPVHLLPDAHPGFVIPHGSVVGFSMPEARGQLSGVSDFDHAFGLRVLLSSLSQSDLLPRLGRVHAGLQTLAAFVPQLPDDCSPVLIGGAHWAIEQGWGCFEDLAVCESPALLSHSDLEPSIVATVRRWQHRLRLPALGNQQLEIHVVDELLDPDCARASGLEPEQVLVLVHAGSAGLGPQLARALASLADHQLWLPLASDLGQRALRYQRMALQCASAFRQALTQQVRELFWSLWPEASLSVLCDFPHNSFELEPHLLGHDSVNLWVQRCGAVRAFGPSHGDHPATFRKLGTPVSLGGSIGSPTELVCGVDSAEQLTLSSSVWGMGAAEVAEHAGLCRRVARLRPVLSVQG